MINEIIDQIITKVKNSALEGLSIEAFPDKPDDYVPLSAKGAVLVRYMGSDYGKPSSTDIIIQDRKMQFCVSVMFKSLRPVKDGVPSGVYSAIEEIKKVLTGFKPTGFFSKFYVIKDAYQSNNNGYWLYDIVFSTSTKSFEFQEEQNLPRLEVTR